MFNQFCLADISLQDYCMFIGYIKLHIKSLRTIKIMRIFYVCEPNQNFKFILNLCFIATHLRQNQRITL